MPVTIASSDNVPYKRTPYGISKFTAWSNLKEIEQLKVAWGFNFSGTVSVNRALTPASYAIKTTTEYGEHEFNPIHSAADSHGDEVAIWVKRYYKKYTDIIDHAARLSETGVRF